MLPLLTNLTEIVLSKTKIKLFAKKFKIKKRKQRHNLKVILL